MTIERTSAVTLPLSVWHAIFKQVKRGIYEDVVPVLSAIYLQLQAQEAQLKAAGMSQLVLVAPEGSAVLQMVGDPSISIALNDAAWAYIEAHVQKGRMSLIWSRLLNPIRTCIRNGSVSYLSRLWRRISTYLIGDLHGKR
jgi:hypothetical protein